MINFLFVKKGQGQINEAWRNFQIVMDGKKDFTKILQDFSDGKHQSKELLPYIYDELYALARAQRRRYNSGETLNTTALVHEAYLKMVNHSDQNWEARTHFYSVAAKAMRSILVDHAKMHNAAKRGGGQKPVTYNDQLIATDEQANEILDLNNALNRLGKIAKRQSKVVELRFFCGFTIEETAKIMGLSTATVKRDWNLARSWLYQQMRSDNS